MRFTRSTPPRAVVRFAHDAYRILRRNCVLVAFAQRPAPGFAAEDPHDHGLDSGKPRPSLANVARTLSPTGSTPFIQYLIPMFADDAKARFKTIDPGGAP